MKTVLIPIKTSNGLNAREHWAVRAKRVKRERGYAATLCPAHGLPCVVTLTRYSAGTLDGDNLQGSLKGIRDGVADKLGVDDRDPRVIWEYEQSQCPRNQYFVRITIRGTDADA